MDFWGPGPGRGLFLLSALLCGALGQLGGATVAQAVEGAFPSHLEPYFLDSGSHNGGGQETKEVFSSVVEFPDAPWLRLYFDDCELGVASFIAITSRRDGSSQRLNGVSLAHYHHASVFFNGDAVTVALHVAPEDRGVYFRLREVAVGDYVGAGGKPPGSSSDGSKAICGDTDDRVPSSRGTIGRILENLGSNPGTGTGWIAANGALVTAGHNVSYGIMNILQFNVPQSLVDGTPQHPPTEYQYYIVDHPDSLIYFDDGNDPPYPAGNDWAVFTVYPNSNTGLMPLEAQGAFIRVTRDLAPDDVRVTGYGVITTSNYTSRTQQTHTGPFDGETYEGPSDVILNHEADTTGGESGAPVEDTLYGYALGIHTDGSCATLGYNRGCSIENDSFEQALNGFLMPLVVYADIAHVCPYEDGTLCRPYDSVIQAAAACPSGGTVYIIGGNYSDTGAISHPCTLRVPPVGGPAILGQ
jgi:hypothetical protein